MAQRSIYLSDEEDTFVKRYIKDFPKLIRQTIQDALEKEEAFCDEQIKIHKEEMKRWEALKEKNLKDQEDREKFIQELNEQCKSRPEIAIEAFLSGKTGKKLLNKCKLTKHEFLEKRK